MKFIDAGYQYNVYDLGNGRVLKKKCSTFRTFHQMFRVYRGHGLSQFLAFKKSLAFLKKSKDVTFEVKRRLPQLPHNLLGNPVFKKGINYEQDKVEIVEKYLNSHSLEENKLLIDKYIQLIQLLWGYGIHDAIYKIRANYGVNSQNEIILIDFNEVTFSKDEVLESIRNKDWLRSRWYARLEEGELKSYYTASMDTEITEENFNLHWQKKTK
jgi:hypothetical protein